MFVLSDLFSGKKRIEHIDIARSMCMLWIVGVWHMCSGYLGIPIDKNDYFRNLTYGVLTLFFFVSGVLSGKRKLKGKSEVIGYIRHKFWGLYPLYLLSALGFIALGVYKSKLQIVTTVLCVGEFFTPMIKTIWFVEVLFLFFLLTPFFIYDCKAIYKVIAAIVIYGAFLLDYYTLGICDERIIRYLPAYVVGLYLFKVVKERRKPLVSILMFAASLALFLLLSAFADNTVWYIAMLVGYAGAIAIYSLADIASNVKGICNVASVLAYVSTFAFLFHRHIYGTFKILLGVHRFKIWQAYAIVLPCMLILAFLGQKLYDMLSGKLKRKK